MTALAELMPWPKGLITLFSVRSWQATLSSVAVALVAFALGRACSWLLVALLTRWSRRRLTPVDDLVVKQLRDPLRWLGPLVAVILALPLLDIEDATAGVLRHVFVVAAICDGGWLFLRLVESLTEIATERLADGPGASAEVRAKHTQLRSFGNIASVIIAIVTLGLALLSFSGVRELGVSLLASAGVAGLVLGFAAQKGISAITSGLVIALAQPIRINDSILVEGEFGTVEEINLTFVIVRVWDGRRLVLPVGYFLEKPFQNWSRTSTELLATALLSFDYSVPLDALRAELQRILEQSPAWNRRFWKLEVTDATDRVIVVRAAMTAADADRAWALRCEVREKLVAFVQHDYPHALPRQRSEAWDHPVEN